MAIITEFKDKVDALVQGNKIFITGWPGTGKSTSAKKLSKLKETNCFHLDLLREKEIQAGRTPDGVEHKLKPLIANLPSYVTEGTIKHGHHVLTPMSDITVWNDSNVERMIKVFNSQTKPLAKSTDIFDLDFSLRFVPNLIKARQSLMDTYAGQKSIIETESFAEWDELLYSVEKELTH
jgi:hypothetical protein